jgi:hypothetical protein
MVALCEVVSSPVQARGVNRKAMEKAAAVSSRRVVQEMKSAFMMV